MTTQRRRWGLGPIVLAATLALVGSACGSSVSPTAAPASTAPSAAPGTSSAPATAATPVVSDKPLRIGWSSEPDTLNPLTTYSTEGTEVIGLIYDHLLGYGTDFKPQPELATDYTVSADGLSTTFTLRSGVTWSDGTPFTSADVKFTYDLIKKESLGGYAQWLTHLAKVDAPDAGTVVLTYDAPQAFNPAVTIPILPEHIWGGMSSDQIQAFPNATPVGTGPYTFAEWKTGESLTLVRNEAFWGTPPGPAGVIYVLYANEDVMAQALKRGDVDILTEVPPTIWDGVQGSENVKAVSLPSWSFHHIGFNVSAEAASKGNPLLRDVKVRQALSFALDRNQLVEIALAGHGQVGSTLVPVGLADWHYEPTAEEAMNADPAKANALLDAAGYKDTNGDGVREDAAGKPLQFRLIAIESTSVDVRAAQLFATSAQAVGVKLDVSTLDENTLGSTVYNTDAPDWDIFVWGWDSSVPDPGYMLGVPLCSQIGNNNDVFYCDKDYDALYDKQASTLDPVARKALTDEMQRKFYTEAPYLVMWYQDKLQAYRTDTWKGWSDLPGGLVFNFTRANYLQITPAG